MNDWYEKYHKIQMWGCRLFAPLLLVLAIWAGAIGEYTESATSGIMFVACIIGSFPLRQSVIKRRRPKTENAQDEDKPNSSD